MVPQPAPSGRAWLDGLEVHGIKLGLETTRTLVAALGHPERASPVIHVAGTNGKGSVAAMVSTALTAAGHRTARHTSPHLVRLEERFAIDGEPIAAEALDEVIERVRAAIVGLQRAGALGVEPTFFEATTVCAFEAFRHAAVDVAVHEVGLGGRLDATNVVAPLVTAITTIARDHEAQLGGTLAGIAAEKSGIAKRGVPLIVGPLAPEARAAVDAAAREAGAPVLDAPAATAFDLQDGRVRVLVQGRRQRYGPLRLGLRGRHQVVNAAVAVGVLEAAADGGLSLPPGTIETGLEDVRWPGRLDLIACGDRRVLVDGAHNPAGMAALASYVREIAPRGLPMVFGAMSDKRVDDMLAALHGVARPLVLTRASAGRAASLEALEAAAAATLPGVEVVRTEDPVEALAAAWQRAPLIAVAGSLYLAGDVLALLGTQAETGRGRRMLR